MLVGRVCFFGVVRQDFFNADFDFVIQLGLVFFMFNIAGLPDDPELAKSRPLCVCFDHTLVFEIKRNLKDLFVGLDVLEHFPQHRNDIL